MSCLDTSFACSIFASFDWAYARVLLYLHDSINNLRFLFKILKDTPSCLLMINIPNVRTKCALSIVIAIDIAMFFRQNLDFVSQVKIRLHYSDSI